MNYLTSMEEDWFNFLLTLRLYLEKPMTPKQYQHMMGEIRDRIKTLENKRLGCKSGKHTSYCLCESGIERNVAAIKMKRWKARQK